LLKLIGERLQEVADMVVGFYRGSVLKCLERAQGDRVLKVRQAAIPAKHVWQVLQKMYSETEVRKTN